MTAADKEPINVALNVFIRIPTPENPRMDFGVFRQSCGRMRHRKADKLRDLTSRRCSLLRAVMLGGLDRLHARVPNVRGCQGLTPLRGRQSRPLTAPNIRKEAGQAIKAAPWPRRPQPADGARRFARKSGGSRSRNKAPIHRTLLASIHQNSPTRLHEDPHPETTPRSTFPMPVGSRSPTCGPETVFKQEDFVWKQSPRRSEICGMKIFGHVHFPGIAASAEVN